MLSAMTYIHWASNVLMIVSQTSWPKLVIQRLLPATPEPCDLIMSYNDAVQRLCVLRELQTSQKDCIGQCESSSTWSLGSVIVLSLQRIVHLTLWQYTLLVVDVWYKLCRKASIGTFAL